MSIHSGVFHGDGGKIVGCYVYMLLCRDDGPVYVKVGVSDDPLKRFRQLRNGCPVTPRRLAFCGVRTRKAAFRLEAMLIATFKKWAAHGEWFKVPLEDKPDFNAAWKSAFEIERRTLTGDGWEHIPVSEIVRISKARKNYWMRKYATGGQAFKDFCKDSAGA